MKTYKPDLNEKITIRLSVESKRMITKLCSEVDFDESTIVRTALEAGIQLAREKGIVAMIGKRQEGVRVVKKRPEKLPKKKAKADLILVKNTTGKSWRLENQAKEVLTTGPLYEVRAKARALCANGSVAEIRHPDGRVEQLA